MSILEIKDVTYGYTKLEHILFEVNQNFECGKFYAIIGKSGAGKSTLLSLLADVYKRQIYKWTHKTFCDSSLST